MTQKRRHCPRNHDTAKVGRDSSGRCLECKRGAGRAARWLRVAEDRGLREAERARRQEEERAAREAEEHRKQQETDRRLEAKYRAAIKRGGRDALKARWDRANHEMLEKTESRYGLCRWEDDGPDGELVGPMCYRRTTDVFCWRHNKQLDRETARRRRDQRSPEGAR